MDTNVIFKLTSAQSSVILIKSNANRHNTLILDRTADSFLNNLDMNYALQNRINMKKNQTHFEPTQN